MYEIHTNPDFRDLLVESVDESELGEMLKTIRESFPHACARRRRAA